MSHPRDRADTAADAVMVVIRTHLSARHCTHLSARHFAAMREEIATIIRAEVSDALWQARGERHLDD